MGDLPTNPPTANFIWVYMVVREATGARYTDQESAGEVATAD